MKSKFKAIMLRMGLLFCVCQSAFFLGGCWLFESGGRGNIIKPEHEAPKQPKLLKILTPGAAAVLKQDEIEFRWELLDNKLAVDHVVINIFKEDGELPYIQVYDAKHFLNGSYKPGAVPEGVQEVWRGVGAHLKKMEKGKNYEFRILVGTKEFTQSSTLKFRVE